MAFTLPANSRIGQGKTYKAPADAQRVREFRIYRWNPDDGQNPRTDTYEVDLDACGPMVLDALIKIKNEVDPTLTFRRSCREGICGSCAMNIDGGNTLACLKPIDDVKGAVRISPLPHMPVVKDLVPDLSQVYAQLPQHRAMAAGRQPGRRRMASGCKAARSAPSWTDCGNASCASAAPLRCPSYWWNGDRYLGPAVLLQAYRWIADSRDEYTGESAGCAGGPVQAVSLPHDHELHRYLSEGAEPGEGDRRDQAADRRAAGLGFTRLPDETRRARNPCAPAADRGW